MTAPTILYVEDWKLLADATVRFLERNGWKVYWANAVTPAMALLTGPQPLVQAVITDWNLGGETGEPIVAWARENRVPCLVMSGRHVGILPFVAKGDLDGLRDWLRSVRREETALERGFDPLQPHVAPDQDDELGGGRRRDPSNPACRCTELGRCASCIALDDGRRKGASDRAQARAMFEAAGKPIPSWAREP